jgi:hypothetical protein
VNRWLLENLNTWELALLVVGVFVVLALLGVQGAKRWFPHLRAGEHNDVAGIVIGVLSVAYSILLAFVLVELYGNFQDAGTHVRSEATALALVHRDTGVVQPALARRVADDVGSYIQAVVDVEWDGMADGRQSPKAEKELADLYGTLGSFEPRTESQKAFYNDAVRQLNDVADARRQRLDDAQSNMPIPFEVLLISGAVLLVCFTFLLGMRSVHMHRLMAVAVAALVGFNLLLALVLAYPFTGSIAVGKEPFLTGSLARFAPIVERYRKVRGP